MSLSTNMFGLGEIISREGGGSIFRWLVFLGSQFLFAVALTSLYLGMRGVMRLGGFVASGGPYEIAHPAPGWIWIMPVSIFLGLISVFVSFVAGHKLGGPNLLVLSWSALFVSLGWNFMEFGFSPPGSDGLAWGWIICGVLFIPMGAIPLLIIIQTVRSSLRSRKQNRLQRQTETGEVPKGQNWGFSLLMQFIAVGLGIFLGIRFFENQVNPRQPATPNQQIVQKAVPKNIPRGTGTIEFQKQGKTVTLMALPDGTWDIIYEGSVVERIGDLPLDIQRLFRDSLVNVKGIKE